MRDKRGQDAGFVAEKILLTAQQVSRRLSIRVATVYAAAEDGRLPCVRLWEGRRRALIRFRAEDIEQLIQARSTGSMHRPAPTRS